MLNFYSFCALPNGVSNENLSLTSQVQISPNTVVIF